MLKYRRRETFLKNFKLPLDKSEKRIYTNSRRSVSAAKNNSMFEHSRSNGKWVSRSQIFCYIKKDLT